MNRFKVFIFVLIPIFLFGQSKIQFQDYFEDKTMRKARLLTSSPAFNAILKSFSIRF